MSFYEELKRRNVVKAAVLYVIASWLILQIADVLFDAMELPPTWVRLVLAILILGFPLALIFSWVFEITPEGLQREKDVDRSQSITADTGRKVNVLIIAMLALHRCGGHGSVDGAGVTVRADRRRRFVAHSSHCAGTTRAVRHTGPSSGRARPGG